MAVFLKTPFLTDGIDTAGTAGKLFFHIMVVMAEMERDLNRERTTTALIVARRAGRIGGQKTVTTSMPSYAGNWVML